MDQRILLLSQNDSSGVSSVPITDHEERCEHWYWPDFYENFGQVHNDLPIITQAALNMC